MKKIFEKYETFCTIALIVIYIALNSFCQQNFGISSIKTVLINSVLSVALIALMTVLKKVKYYGFSKVKSLKSYLYFIPLIPLATVNLWNGLNLQSSAAVIVLHVLTMINVGFIEEVIFRGFLFKMMEKSNLKVAIIVNALTFGFGHIVNLFNGADIVPTLLQICYATAIGFLFVIIFYKCKSIVPCIITHIFVNATSILSVESEILTYVTPIATGIIAVGYALYISKTVKE